MRRIEIVSNLKMHPTKGLISRDKNGCWTKTHYQQGHLDGACAVYSVVMNLLVLRKLTKKDVDIDEKIDKRQRKGKLLSDFFEKRGANRDGYCFSTLKQVIDNRKIEGIETIRTQRPKKNDSRKYIEKITNRITEDEPVVISVCQEYGGHALLVVGVEYNERNNPCRLLCLDPGAPSPTYAQWNSYIDISKDSDMCWYVYGTEIGKVELGEILQITEIE